MSPLLIFASSCSSVRGAEAGAVHPTGERLPQRVREKADEDVSPHTLFFLMPDRAEFAFIFGDSETAFQYVGVTHRQNKPKASRSSRHKRYISVEQDAGPEAVIRVLLAICTNGHNLSAKKNALRDRKLYDVARRCFGSWSQALTAAGINLENSQLPVRPRRIARDNLLAQIHERHAAGKSLAWKQVSLENRALATAVKTVFKSWYRALLAAGLATEKPLP